MEGKRGPSGARDVGETKLLTAGVAAERLGAPLHRVLYVLRTRQHIQPVARAGTFRLYSTKSLPLLRDELDAIAARRGKRGQP